MQPAPPPACPPRTQRPAREALILLAAGFCAAAGGVIFPSAPSSDSWLPYALELRVAAERDTRLTLWWDRHAGYVTAPEAAANANGGTELARVAIGCPAGNIRRLILQASPTVLRLARVAELREGSVQATSLTLRDVTPLHGTCTIATQDDELLVRPVSNGDMEIEIPVRPMLDLPVPLDGAPASVHTVVARERFLGATLMLVGIAWVAWLRGTARSDRAPWTFSRSSNVIGAAAIYAAVAIAFCRRPDVFALPQFWAEDGAVFFAEQQRLGPSAAFQSYAGYLHLWPRLVAIIASLLPMVWAPTLYLLGAVAVLALAVWRITSLRSGFACATTCALAIVLVPHMGELLLSVTNAQWFGAIALLAVAMARAPLSRTERVGDWATIILFGLTGPFALLFLPLFFWRAWRGRDRDAHITAVLATTVAAIQIVTYLRHAAAVPDAHQEANQLLALLAATGLRTGGEFLGLAEHVRGAVAEWVGCALLVAWIGMWWLAPRRETGEAKAMLGWAAFAILAGGLLRFRSYPDELFGVTHAQRYFHLPLLITIWLLITGVARTSGWRRTLCGATMVLLGAQQIGTFRIAPLVDFNWRERVHALASGQAAEIPINPAPWAIVRPAASSNHGDTTKPAETR